MLAFRVRELDETTSTNDEVKRALEAGEAEGLAVRALRQTGGYGRLGRAWASPAGGLYLSLLLRPRVEPAVLPTLSLAAGLAVRRAAAGLLPAAAADSVQLKWPNDLVVPAAVPFRKLCGISVEAHAGGVCVGIGVNVEAPAVDDDAVVGGKNTPVYLRELDFAGGVDDVGEAVFGTFAPLYDAWLAAGFAPFAAEYNARAALTGRSVRMANQAGGTVACGEVVSVDEHGRLILRASDGALMPVASGEAHLA